MPDQIWEINFGLSVTSLNSEVKDICLLNPLTHFLSSESRKLDFQFPFRNIIYQREQSSLMRDT